MTIKFLFRKLKVRLRVRFKKEVGYCIPYVQLKQDGKLEKEIRKTLKSDASKIMPKNYYIEIVRKIPTDFGRNRGLAWYWHKDMPNKIQRLPTTDNNKILKYGKQVLERFLT